VQICYVLIPIALSCRCFPAARTHMTIGGGSAMIATLHREITTKRDWVTQRQFDLSYVLSRLTPGTNLLAFSTAIGWPVSGERRCSADEILQGRLIDLVAFVDVDGAPGIPVEAGVE
jgi:chromate transport protein ChrA